MCLIAGRMLVRWKLELKWLKWHGHRDNAGNFFNVITGMLQYRISLRNASKTPISQKFSLPINYFLAVKSFWNFCTEHGSIIAVLCAKFPNDLTPEMDVDGQDFMRFEFKMSFEVYAHYPVLPQASGTHFTKGLWAHNPNLIRICVAVAWNYDDLIRSQFRRCDCSWAVQMCDLIRSSKLKLKRNVFLSELKNRWWNGWQRSKGTHRNEISTISTNIPSIGVIICSWIFCPWTGQHVVQACMSFSISASRSNRQIINVVSVNPWLSKAPVTPN